jgi:hypothetical protein
MSRKAQPHSPEQKPGSVKLKLDTREYDAHLCGRTKNGVTVHIFRRDAPVECEPDWLPRWEPRGRE